MITATAIYLAIGITISVLASLFNDVDHLTEVKSDDGSLVRIALIIGLWPLWIAVAISFCIVTWIVEFRAYRKHK